MRSRFRRKSDAKRSELPSEDPSVASSSRSVPLPIVTQQVHVHRSPILPALPPASDFRTSLILPDLTRRFTLLRSATGDPVSLDDLRNRLASQRAKGVENQISEEEEDMLLDMLSRVGVHSAALGGAGSKVSTMSDTGSTNTSVRAEPSYTSFSSNELASSSTSSTVRQSTQSTMSSIAGSSSFGSGPSRASKRHSNNLFNAGQTRDMRYMRKTSNRTMSSNRSGLSSVMSDSTTGSVANALIDSYADGQGRPVTPENDTSVVNESPSPAAAKPAQEIGRLHTVPSDDGLGRLRNAGLRLSRQMTQGQIHRISMSLEGVFREIEEEADDQVLVPRTSTFVQQDGGLVAGGAHELPRQPADDGPISPKALAEPAVDSTAMNWIADVDRPGSASEGPRSPSPYRAGGSTSPVPRVPGYIPGMPRPVTPVRNADFDDVRSHSTTPRATSPSSAYGRATGNALPLSASASSLIRQGRASPTPYSGRPVSPLASPKYQLGHIVTEDRHRNGNAASDHSPLGSHWRRPSSPLSNNNGAFQSLNSSRPGTPSNVTWNVSGRTSDANGKPLGRNGTLLGHSRSQSSSSVGASGQDGESNSDSGKNTLQSPRPSYISSSPENGGVSSPRSKFLSNGSSLPTSFSGSNESSFDVLSTPPSSNYHNDLLSSNIEDFTQDLTREKQRLLSPPTSTSAVQKNGNPLYLSPVSNNSSKSSLVSAGSSYHSWEEETGFGAGFLVTQEKNEPAWHEITPTLTTVGLSYHSRPGSHTNVTSDDPETVLRQFTGLSKIDLRMIQDKLLETSQLREKNLDMRSPSALRRRRPSVSQAMLQPSRTTSPAPPPVGRFGFDAPGALDGPVVPDASLLPTVDSTGPRSHWYNDPLESEESDAEMSPPPPIVDTVVTNSPGRRNKDLAEILFGPSDTLPQVPQPEGESMQGHQQEVPEEQDRHAEEVHNDDGFEPVSTITPRSESRALPQTELERLKSGAIVPPSPDPVDLVRQIQERNEAAMAQLQRSPQQNRFPSPGSNNVRKKIHLQDISGPLLVQSSTSIDKIPTVPTSPQPQRQTDGQRSVKLSFSKRLRNTLRSKNAPNGEEITPWTNESVSSLTGSPLVGNRNLSPSKLGNHGFGSTNEIEVQPKPANISPPASAGPSLKNFMSRFRKKGQAEGNAELENRNGLTQVRSSDPPAASAPPMGRTSFQLSPVAPLLGRSGSVSQSQTRKTFAPSMSRQPTETPTIIAPSSPPPPPQSNDTGALRQFYEAAQNLGLDESAVNDLLSRSNTVKSTASAAESHSRNDSTDTPYLDAPRAISPLVPEVFIERAPVDLDRTVSQRRQAASPTPIPPRRIMELAEGHGGGARNTVLRRTLIFPSGNGSSSDVSALARRTSKSRKRASAMSSASSRSVHDRVPTPPPTRAKRQSQDPSPPMPNLPWTNQPGRTPARYTPETPIENANSPYDSFYEFYSGDRSGSVHSPDFLEPPKTPIDDQLPEMEDGQALEVIELANGETIWSIVNGLRADDAESFYPRRGSFESEYSAGAHHDANSGAEQLFFKEHTRTGSKGSVTSNFGRRRSQMPARPETKVFYSSSTHIAKLIDQLSRSTEAATFTIKPKDMPELPILSPVSPSGPASTPGHSHSNSVQTTSSDRHWTAVEERLEQVEHMLGTMGTAS